MFVKGAALYGVESGAETPGRPVYSSAGGLAPAGSYVPNTPAPSPVCCYADGLRLVSSVACIHVPLGSP